MGTWSIIAIIYLAIGFIHLTVHTAKAVKALASGRSIGDPMEVVVVTFAWPIIDILWLNNILHSSDLEDSSHNACIRCGNDIEEGRTVCGAWECGGEPIPTRKEDGKYD